ncbi:hypothetical protein DSECCO2_643950 [anaerobic digester metagenome]
MDKVGYLGGARLERRPVELHGPQVRGEVVLQVGHELAVVLLELDRPLERQDEIGRNGCLLFPEGLPADRLQVVERLGVVPLPEGETGHHLLELAYPLRDEEPGREETVGSCGEPVEFMGGNPHRAPVGPLLAAVITSWRVVSVFLPGGRTRFARPAFRRTGPAGDGPECPVDLCRRGIGPLSPEKALDDRDCPVEEVEIVHSRDVLAPLHEGEGGLEVLADRLDLPVIDRARRSFQAMDRPVNPLDQLGRRPGLLQRDQPLGDCFKVLVRLLAERLEETGTKYVVRSGHGRSC